MSLAPKRIPSRYQWDPRGSRLYSELCDQPEYTLLRAELEILERHGLALSALVGEDIDLVELGTGDGRRARALLSALDQVGLFVPVDIEREQLSATTAAIRNDMPSLAVQPLCADFSEPLKLPERRPGARMVVYVGGSTLGCVTRAEAHLLLERLGRLCGKGGGIIIGVDLKRDPGALHRAYNDQRSVAATLSQNVLVRASREAGARICLDQFRHYAYYEPDPGRVVTTLVSTAKQTASVGNFHVDFEEGEPLVVSHAYKFTMASLERLGVSTGLKPRATFCDGAHSFAVAYFEA